MPLFELPVPRSTRVTQKFGANPSRYKRFGFPGHEGIDWGVPTGTPITACADGRVTRVYRGGVHPYGIHIRVQHELDGAVYETVYAHLSGVLVSEGELVKTGQRLALSGNTGNSTGPHLHLTVVKKGATALKETNYPRDVVDPTPLLRW